MRSSLLNALSLVWELGYIIAGPLVVLGLLGRYLDKRLESSPIFLLAGLLLSMIASGILVARKVRKILKDSDINQ